MDEKLELSLIEQPVDSKQLEKVLKFASICLPRVTNFLIDKL